MGRTLTKFCRHTAIANLLALFCTTAHSTSHQETTAAFCQRYMALLGAEENSIASRLGTRILLKANTPQTFGTALEQAKSGSPNRFFTNLAHSLKLDRTNDLEVAKIPTKGPLVVVSNHPFGFADAFALSAFVEKARAGEVRIIANADALKLFPELSDYVFPLNLSDGKSPEKHAFNRQSIQNANEWLRDGKAIVIFPSGVISRKGDDGKISELEWSNTVVKLIKNSNASILPVHFSGELSPSYYKLYRILPALGILRLPWETTTLGKTGIEFKVGHPMPAAILAADTNHHQSALFLREQSMRLAEKPPPATIHALKKVQSPEPTHEVREELEKVLKAPRKISGLELIAFSESDFPNLANYVRSVKQSVYDESGLTKNESSLTNKIEKESIMHCIWDHGSARLVGGLTVIPLADSAFQLREAFVDQRFRGSDAYSSLFGNVLKSLPQNKDTKLIGYLSVPKNYSPLSTDLIATFARRNKVTEEIPLPHLENYSFLSGVGADRIQAMLKNIETLDDLDKLIKSIEPDGKGLPILFRFYKAITDYQIHTAVFDPDYENLDLIISGKPFDNPKPLVKRLLRNSQP